MKYCWFIILGLTLASCISVKPNYSIGEKPTPAIPDYSQEKFWAALPSRADLADVVPDTSLFKDRQATGEVDVFFLHPTTYTGKKGQKNWNASLDDAVLNSSTDEGSIKYQGSIFNGVGRVYAPRYRQAHYHSYFTADTKSATAAFKIAYDDVKSAFEFYLKNYNQGRPIIIAGHSQGAQHGYTLLKEYFDQKALEQQLVVAYLIGMPIPKAEMKNIALCEDERAVNCFCSWRTFKKGHLPKKGKTGDHIGVTNPLTWETTSAYAPASLNQGAILRKFEGGLLPEVTDAQINDGYLWASKPDFAGSIFITFKNYHVADLNLYYTNIRKNAQGRAQEFLNINRAAK